MTGHFLIDEVSAKTMYLSLLISLNEALLWLCNIPYTHDEDLVDSI